MWQNSSKSLAIIFIKWHISNAIKWFTHMSHLFHSNKHAHIKSTHRFIHTYFQLLSSLSLCQSYTQQIGSNPVIAQVRRKKTLFLSVVQKMQNLSKKYQIPKSTYRKIRNRMLLLCNQEFPFFFCQNKNHFTTFLRSK